MEVLNYNFLSKTRQTTLKNHSTTKIQHCINAKLFSTNANLFRYKNDLCLKSSQRNRSKCKAIFDTVNNYN